MLGLLLAVFAVFSIIICVSLKFFEPPNRQLFVGYLSVLSLISMFASPLFIIVSAATDFILLWLHPSFLRSGIGAQLTHFCDNGWLQNLVIKTKSVEYMPFYLSLATFLMSLSFFGYGMFKQDLFISVSDKPVFCIIYFHYFFGFFYLNSSFIFWQNLIFTVALISFVSKQVPNGIGGLLGIIQLVLYFCYSRSSDGGRPRAPLLESYAWNTGKIQSCS